MHMSEVCRKVCNWPPSKTKFCNGPQGRQKHIITSSAQGIEKKIFGAFCADKPRKPNILVFYCFFFHWSLCRFLTQNWSSRHWNVDFERTDRNLKFLNVRLEMSSTFDSLWSIEKWGKPCHMHSHYYFYCLMPRPAFESLSTLAKIFT